jgi:YYY domain-containing protein
MPLSELFAALRWWIAIMILGMAATPLAFVIFQKLPDRGYAFVKMLGFLLVSYFFWMLGSLGFLGNNSGGILLSLVLVVGLSLFLYRRQISILKSQPTADGMAPGLRSWLGQNRSHVIITELVFAVLFIAWVWVRAQNPAITATEKPMEFAFLNSVGRSFVFPALDPWLSGFAISYYYFGYVMTSLLARLALVSEPIAFNLAVAWLVAGTGTAAFGLVFNLLRIQKVRRGALVLGLMAAIALPLAGNLVIGLELAHGNNLGSPAFWQWLDIRELNEVPNAEGTPRYESSSWWWWRSSRPIREVHLSGRPEDGLEPIAEFPAFSFILGDLHPHVLALPFAFLALALALVWWQQDSSGEKSQGLAEGWDLAPWPDRLRMLIHFISLPLWLLSAVILGGLSFLNTWDVLIYLFVVCGAYLLARWRDNGWHTRIITQTITVAFLLLLPIILLYLPFYAGFRSQAGAPYLLPQIMRPTRLVQYLVIFGMPLWVVTILLIAQAARQKFRYWKSGLIMAVSLILILLLLTFFFGLIVAASSEGGGRVSALANELGIALAPRPEGNAALGWGFTAVLAIAPHLLLAKITYPALTLFLAAAAGLVAMIWREQLDGDGAEAPPSKPGPLPFVLLLIATAVLLTLGPEFVYLRDNFGFRLNTIFKFYYQAWVMFGVAALFAIGYLWQQWQGSRRFIPALATAGYVFAFIIAILFPIFAVNSRAAEFRGLATAEDRQPATLNGLAQVNRFNPDEYAAIMWLRENVTGAPVITEAVGGQYSNYGRISANTGLPTILGWAGHEYQWRGSTPEPAAREPAVNSIYSQTNLNNVADLLNQYNVQYIYVGGLERDTYGPAGLDKFAEQLDVAYSNNSVTIYRWQPQ